MGHFLVLRLSSVGVQIANYEYGFFWYLYQDGTIQHEVKLTGILSTNGMSEGEVRLYAPPVLQ